MLLNQHGGGGEAMILKFQFAGLIAACVMLAACIELGAAPGGIEAPEEARGVKNLIVYRRPAFFLDNKPVVLVLDDLDIAKIRVNEFVEVGLVRGYHTLGARCSTSERPLTRDWRLVELRLDIVYTEDVHFIELGPCLFTERSREEAERALTDYTYRPLKDGASVRLREWMDEQKRKGLERLRQ